MADVSASFPNPEMVPPLVQQYTGATSYNQFFAQFDQKIRSLCYRFLKNQDEVEDMIQEIRVKCFKYLHTFQGDSAFNTWLHRLIVNECLMHLRSKRRRFHRELASVVLNDSTNGEQVIWDAPQEDPRLRSCLDRIALERALAELPERYRQVILMFYCDGFSMIQICEKLGCTLPALKSMLCRGRLKLREQLQQ